MKQKKNRLFCMILAVLAVVFTFSGLAKSAPAQRTRLGVVSFTNGSSHGGKAFGSNMADILISELIQNKNYDVIERARLDAIFGEQAIGGSGAIDASTAADIGKVQGLNYIVVGNVVEAGQKTVVSDLPVLGRVTTTTSRVVVNIRVIEAETGKIELAETGTGESTKDMGEAAQRAIARVALEIRNTIHPVEATVVVVDIPAKELTIDLGREDGFKIGQRYEIINEREPIIGRDGTIIGMRTKKVADITITRVETALSIGKIDKRYKEKVETPPGSRKYKDVEMPINEGDIARPIGAKR